MTATSRQPSFWTAFTERARGLLGKEERRLGGISKTRVMRAPDSELMAPLCTLKMLGLSEIQAGLADRWPAVSEKVHAITQNTISKHLARGDVFQRLGDDGYMILFSNLGVEEAELKSRIIAKELTEHLLGERDAGPIRLSTLCTTISVKALAGDDQDSALAEALTRAAPPREPDRAQGAAPAGAEPPEPVRTAGAVRRTTTQIYSPLWDVAQMTLLRFRAVAADGPLVAISDPNPEATATQNDLIRIQAVIEDLYELVQSGRRLPVTIPIQHASLGSVSQRGRIQKAISESPHELRKLITVEICSPNDEFWTYSCRTFLETARTLNIGWSALIALDHPSLIPHPRSLLRGVGAVISVDEHNEAERLRLMKDFGQRARLQGVECAAYGLTSRALVLGAVGAGFRFLSGPAIQKDVRGIANAVRFDPLDLYRDIIDGRASLEHGG